MPLSKDAIAKWMGKIASSRLSIDDFFDHYSVPFSRTQYYRYKQRIKAGGDLSPFPGGRRRKISEREELYLSGIVSGGAIPSIEQLCEMVEAKLGTVVSRSVMHRALQNLFPDHQRPGAGRPRVKSPPVIMNALGGFELLIAVAYYLKWPERVASVIETCVRERNRKSTRVRKDLLSRSVTGRFTGRYNRRKDVRAKRFASVSEKRETKRWESMAVMTDQTLTLSRKSLALLSLPVVSNNGSVRNVNVALGQSLGHLCGYNYKQATISKFLSELKYLGAADHLLHDLPVFWKECWGKELAANAEKLTCYYVDGNTKAVWSSKRIKQNKVTMLGRVMGCLEQVFIHDGFGHPIYFETHSGHGPVGEKILGLFEKIESAIMDAPGSRTQVCRAIVMDAASNSVSTLRAFAEQEKYHFITSLDDNQWSERKVRRRSYPMRYRYGPATLRDLDIELADSKQKGYVIVVRAIQINWDKGKQTVLLTGLPRSIVDASEVVRAYFRRWPSQELIFKGMKASVSLNRVCGYGKKLVENERIKERLEKLSSKKLKLEEELKEQLDEISEHDKVLAVLIKRERRLRQKTAIKNGKRAAPSSMKKELAELGTKINWREAAKKKVKKEKAKEFRAYHKTMQEWLRLQSKTTVYELDVELDQILTYYRACLAHLCAYFITHFLGAKKITYAMLFARINQLQAHVEITRHVRKVTLVNNEKDPAMMELLRSAISKLNDLKIREGHGRVYQFAMSGT
jgi:hypothetical protein